ncbi:unnamed protein product, partial [Aureobasidium pullulans]
VKTKTTRKRGTPKGANKLATPTVLLVFIKLPKDIYGRPLRYNLPPKHRDRGLISKVNIIEKAGTIKATKEYARSLNIDLLLLSLIRNAPLKLAIFYTALDLRDRYSLYNDAYRPHLPLLAVILIAVRDNSKPDKAAKVFFAEASRFAEDLITTNGGRKEVVIKIITFRKHCFLIKGEDELEE